MTLLNRASNGHVPSLVVLWRTARVFGPRSRAALEDLCQPRNKTEIIGMTFATWKLLGMFVEGSDDHVRLAPPFERIEQTDTEALRTAVLELLLRPENSPTLLAADLSKEKDESRASDFVRVASWALAQDPYRLSSLGIGAIESEAKAQGLELYHGTGRWNSFQEWAYFCGLAVTTDRGFVMCPARAVRAILSGAHPRVTLPADRDIPLTAFLEDLARAVPVLDGGAHRDRIDELLRARGGGLAVHQISPCLALALLQLDHEEEVILSDRAGDVATRLSLLGRSGQVVKTASHIRRGVVRRRPAAAKEGART